MIALYVPSTFGIVRSINSAVRYRNKVSRQNIKALRLSSGGLRMSSAHVCGTWRGERY